VAAGAYQQQVGADHELPADVFERAIERVVSAVRAGRVLESRLDEAVARILALKRRYPPSSLASMAM
jgi:beta-glucosidase-like glycosyl hydrolase